MCVCLGLLLRYLGLEFRGFPLFTIIKPWHTVSEVVLLIAGTNKPSKSKMQLRSGDTLNHCCNPKKIHVGLVHLAGVLTSPKRITEMFSRHGLPFGTP